ncbi:NOL4L protein, partial [Atractosteus spatula]|nr:NOL4L protein [Atractosteus spatula]
MSKNSAVDLIRRSPVSEGEMFSEFQDWCLRTYGDSGKTKTVTRRKYNKILQTLLQSDESDGVYIENNHINAKFKFWVKSKGFQVGSGHSEQKKAAAGKPVLYVPVKTTVSLSFSVRVHLPSEVSSGFYGNKCVDGVPGQDTSSLKRVAVVEDFFDIIYAMHVEIGTDPNKAPKHAGQKKTYKAALLRAATKTARGPAARGQSKVTWERQRGSGRELALALARRVGGRAPRSCEERPPALRMGAGREHSCGTALGSRLPCGGDGIPITRSPWHLMASWQGTRIAETYAFLPREAVTRFLMSCHECQKRMHVNPCGVESKENDRPSSLAPGLIDYNMPITATYLKQMKLQCMSTNEQDESSVSSEDFDMTDPTWISADHGTTSDLSPCRGERMHSPQNAHKEEDDDSSSESGSGNGLPTLNPPVPGSAADSSSYNEVNGNGAAAPLDFSTTSSSSSSEDQPVNLSERLPPGPLLCPFQPDAPDGLRGRSKYAGKAAPAELRLDYGNKVTAVPARERHSSLETAPALGVRSETAITKSPQYSSGSYDSGKTEVSVCPEDLSMSRAHTADDDDDDHDDHEDSDKINDSEGMDPERLKAFNMFVRLFVDENLDRMVPISKQPKEKIQAIIESCSRQFPEFQERARKRIRTYLKSCRRMKKNGMETRPTPPHLTSAMAENILAAACESETRKAAKRMRLDVYQARDEQIALEKQSAREPATLAPSAYSLAASAYSQDQIYINGGLNYSYRGYGGLGASLQHPVSLTTGTPQSNGPTDLSMKSLASNSSSSSTNSRGVPSAQLSPTEINAVRQLIAGYRESAAFLLRSADELENLILQQN